MNFFKRKLVNNISLFFLCLVFIIFPLNTFSESQPLKPVKVPIIMYHHLDPNYKKWSSAIVSPAQFEQDMTYLKSLGFNTINFKELTDFTEGKGDLPHNPIIITFDDGYKSNYDYAFPILKKLNMKATISIIGWSVGRTKHKDNITNIIPHFSWDEAKEMYESGLIDIQCHTYDMHEDGVRVKGSRKGILKILNENDDSYIKALKSDALTIKNLIKSKLGSDAFVFTYPYGQYNDISEKVIGELGYKVSLTTQEGINTISNNLHMLNRINRPNGISSEKFVLKIINMLGSDYKSSDESNKILKLLKKAE